LKSFIQYNSSCIADRCGVSSVRPGYERVHLCLSVEVQRQMANMVVNQHRG